MSTTNKKTIIMQDFIIEYLDYILGLFGIISVWLFVNVIRINKETKQMYKETKDLIDRIDLKL